MMAHDHGHEQFNDVLKGDSGIIGFTENELALKQFLQKFVYFLISTFLRFL